MDIDVGARAELDHAEALTGPNGLAWFQPAYDSPGDGSRDLLDADQARRTAFFQINPQLFVLDRTLWIARVQKAAGKVTQANHLAGPGNAVDVDVKDRQEDADTEGPPTGEVRFVHFAHMRHFTVCRTQEGVRRGRNVPVGITEKEEYESPADEDNGHRHPEAPVNEVDGRHQECQQNNG